MLLVGATPWRRERAMGARLTSVVALPRLSTISLLFNLATGTDSERYPNALCKRTGLPSGTIVPALQRMTERDHWLARRSAPSTTGRPLQIHTLTSDGWAEVARLHALVAPKIEELASFAECEAEPGGKVNTSTLWILAAASATGQVYGYSGALRPMTHQAAYVELHRMAAAGWLNDGDTYFALTEKGRALGSALFAHWSPLVTAVQRLLPD